MAKALRGGKYSKQVQEKTVPDIYFEIDERRLEYGFGKAAVESMRQALEDVQETIRDYMQTGDWVKKDVDHLYEAMADAYPRSMESDDAERIVKADGYDVTTVQIDFWEDAQGKIQVKLNPASYSYDDFTDKELNDMGLERRTLSRIMGDKKVADAVEKAFHKANLMKEPDIYKALYSYKALKNLSSKDIEQLYDYLSERLFGKF